MEKLARVKRFKVSNPKDKAYQTVSRLMPLSKAYKVAALDVMNDWPVKRTRS